jgi:heat shock protein 90kDa beta
MISDDEYKLFYQATFKDFKNPLAWHHFSGDSGTGVSFRAVIYIPSNLDDSFWNQHEAFSGLDVRLMVKRVFITNDLGEDAMPQWARWIKAVVDADDLPLNVSRETLQSTRFLKQIKAVILKHLIALIARIAEEDKEKFAEIQATYGTVLKLGAVEDTKNRDKLTGLTRFHTNFRNNTSFEEYIANKRKGQKQIFYLADLGKPIPHLAKSIFVEKLDARGYEVLLLNEALDEIMLQNLRTVKNIPFQDVAKIGLKFGDEDPEQEMDEKKQLEEKFQPLLDWLKGHTGDVVRDVLQK